MVTAVPQAETVVPSIKRNPQQVQAPEEQYSAAKNHLNLLTSEQNPKTNRSQWLSLANTFQHLHLQQRSHELGPACLFMTAQVYRMAHLRFHVDDDALTARQKYLELADLYPGHALADDALFEAAALTPYAKDRTPAANILYQQIVMQYPKGDQAARASQLLHPEQSSKKDNLASIVTTTSPQPQPVSSPKNLVNIIPPKFWSSDQY
jgi:N-acetylmuramoyl-L-alanine amidase